MLTSFGKDGLAFRSRCARKKMAQTIIFYGLISSLQYSQHDQWQYAVDSFAAARIFFYLLDFGFSVAMTDADSSAE